MIKKVWCGIVMTAMAMTAQATTALPPIEGVSARARQVHEQAIVLDSHLDTPANLPRPGWNILDRHDHDGAFSQVDLPRMRQGGLDGGFWVIYTAQGERRNAAADQEARDHALVRMAAIREMVAAHADQFEIALTAEDARRIAKAGKRIVFISMENASPLSADPSLLSAFRQLGLRMVGITHFANNDFGDSSTDPKGPEWQGLSPKGKALVAEANRQGVLLDASHASDQVVDQVLELSKAPIVLSHSGAAALYDHPRNVSDVRIKRLAEKGGVIQVNAYSGYLIETPKIAEREAALQALESKFGDESALTPQALQAWLSEKQKVELRYPLPRANIDDYMNHLLHILKVAGVDHVGIGADWDGGGGATGMEDVSMLPLITARLLKAGYDEQDIAKIWGGNLLRVLAAAEAKRELPKPDE